MPNSCQRPQRSNTKPTSMPEFPLSFQKIINRLRFRTNSHTIIPFLLSKKEYVQHLPGFSLNALIELPTNLITPESSGVFRLSLKNSALPILDDQVRKEVVACLGPDYSGQYSPAELDQAITAARQDLDKGQGGKEEGEILTLIVNNHKSTGYFSHIDWALDHWGCIADIQAVTPESFSIPTPGIEFTTLATPPILALQRLANTFPSVRFTLQYAVQDSATWKAVEFHTFPPFGY